MKRFVFILILIISTFTTKAQQHSYVFLAKQYCLELSQYDLNKVDSSEVTLVIMKTGIKVRSNYSDTIESILTKIKDDNDTLNQMDALFEFSKNYLKSLISNCNYYIKANRKILRPIPKDNKTLQYVAIRINYYTKTHSKLSDKELLEQTSNQIFSYVLEIEDQVNIDYIDGIANGQLIDDLNVYLFYKCDDYYKAWLVTQSLKLFLQE